MDVCILGPAAFILHKGNTMEHASVIRSHSPISTRMSSKQPKRILSFSHRATAAPSSLCSSLLVLLGLLPWLVLSQEAHKRQNNILLLLTDDQDVQLGSFDTKNYMPKLHTGLVEEGILFERGALVHVPICCPSRSSLLTGKYVHHGLAVNNSVEGNCYGSVWKESIEPHHTFAVHAKAAGYTTLYAGKYLNRYRYNTSHPEDSVPNGWDYWYGLEGNSRYYNYTIVEQKPNHNKRVILHKHGDSYPRDYLPLVLQNYTINALSTMPEPWLAVVAWPTPHRPFTPEPRFAKDYPEVRAPRTPNYNASRTYQQQKHWLIRQLGSITNSTATAIDRIYQNRLRALETVDNHVGALIQLLGGKQQLDNASSSRSLTRNRKLKTTSSVLDRTMIVYTSDNGFQFGQHRLAIGKRHLYEHDVRVPFVVRVPAGTAKNITVPKERIVSTIDIAPTILDIVLEGIDHPATMNRIRAAKNEMDGISFWKFAQDIKTHDHDDGIINTDGSTTTTNDDPFTQRTDILISYHGEGDPRCGFSQCPPPLDGLWWMPDSYNNTYHCVRTVVSSSRKHNTNNNEDSIYCAFYDDEHFVEFYDLNKNPYQLANDYATLTDVQVQRYEKRLKELLSQEKELLSKSNLSTPFLSS